MVKTWLCAVILAVIGFGLTPASASAADGLAESARTLYWGYLTAKYNETMQNFSKKNYKAGATTIEELKQLEDNLLGLVYGTKEKSEKIDEALGDTWGETLESVEELIRITGVVKVQIGHGALPLDQLEAAYNSVGVDLEQSYAAMTKFGAGYTQLLDWAQQSVDMWDEEVEPIYPQTIAFLKQDNFAEGEEYLEQLKASTDDFFEYSKKANEFARNLTSRLAKLWSDSMVSSAQSLTDEVESLQGKVWQEQLYFDNIDKYYTTTFAYLEDAYAETRVVGDEYLVLCKDGCK